MDSTSLQRIPTLDDLCIRSKSVQYPVEIDAGEFGKFCKNVGSEIFRF